MTTLDRTNNLFEMNDLTKSRLDPLKPVSALRLFCAAVCIGAVLLTGSSAWGQSIWDGGGTDDNFSTPENWVGDIAPVSDPTLVIRFDGAAGTSPVADLNYQVNTITFLNGAAAFDVLGPGAFTVFGGISNADDSLQILEPNLFLADNITVNTTSTGDLWLAGNVSTAGFNTTVNAAAGTTVLFTGNITGTGDLTMNGAGTLELFGFNTYSGTTTMNSGTVLLDFDDVLGDSTVSVAGSSTLQFDDSFLLPVVNNINVANGQTLTIDVNGNGNELSGVISGNGGLQIINSTAGGIYNSIALTGVNNFSGGITIGDGTAADNPRVDINNNSGLGSNANSIDFNIGGLRAMQTINSSRDVNLTTLGRLMADDSRTLTISGTVAGAGDLQIGGFTDDGVDITLHQGTVVLSGANTFTGEVQIAMGTLSISSDSNLGDVTNPILFNVLSSVVVAPFDVTTATLAITGTTTLDALRTVDIANTTGDTAVFQISNGVTGTVDGVISGTAEGTLQKTGAGTLVLTGANDYTGFTLISAGTLQLSGAGTVGVDTGVTVESGAIFDLNGVAATIGSLAGSGSVTLGGATLTTGNDDTDPIFSGVISEAGDVTKDGLGTQTFTGANTYTGLTTINSGALDIQNGSALGTTAMGTVVNTGGALLLEGGIGVGAEDLTLNGDGGSGNGALRNFSGNNSYAGAITLGSDSTIGSDAGTLTISGDIGGNFELTVTGDGNTSISGVIGTGAFDVNKDGSGTLTLSGLNTFSGDMVIIQGTVSVNTIDNVGNPSALGQGNLILGSAGFTGTLSYTGTTTTTDRTVTVANTGSSIGRLQVTTSGQTVTWSSGIDSGGAGDIFNVGGAGNTQIDGVISGDGDVTKDGAGTLFFNNTMTYTGATTISAGTLQLLQPDSVPDTSAMTIASGGTFNMNNLNETIGSLAGAGLVQAGNNTLATGGDNTDTTFSGVISGNAGGLTLFKTGTGTFTLSGNNTYAGQTEVDDGTLLASSNNALGTAAGNTLVNSGASLAFSNNITTSEPLDLSGTGFGGGGALINVSGNNILNGTVLLSANTQINSDAGMLTINGIISGASDLTKDGPATLRLTGANTFTGQLTIVDGTLSVNSIDIGGVASTLGASAAATPVLLGGGGGTVGILEYTGPTGNTDRTFQVVAGGFGRINNNGSPLTLNGDIDNNGEPFSMGGTGNTTLNGDLMGAGNFTKDGTGTVSMGAANTLTGTTTVDAGTLHFLATGSAATSDVTVNAGGTLSGFGTIQSLVNGGVFKQGDASNVTIFNVSGTDFTQTATGNFRPKLGAAGVHDQLDVTAGAANLAGTFGPTLFGGFVPPVGTVITDIITTTGGVVGTFDSVQPMKPVLTAVPIYNPNSVDLVVVRFLTNPALGLDAAQLGLATSLTIAENQAPTADLIDVLDEISTFDTISEVRNAYNEILPRKLDQLGQTSINTTRLQNGNLSTRMNNLRAGVYPRADMFVDNSQMAWNYQGTYLDVVGIPTEGNQKGWFSKFDDGQKNWGVFANGSALFGEQASSVPTQTGYDYTAIGATLGVDYAVCKEFVLGLAGGYNHTDTTVDNNGGNANINTLTVGPYATVQVGDFYADAYAGYAKNFYDVERNIIFGAINRTATGDPNGDQVFSYLGFGYDKHIGDFVTGPIVSLQYTKLWIDAYTESNAGSLNLAIDEQTADSFQSGLGWHWAYNLKVGKMVFLPNITAVYQHEFLNDSRGITAKIAGGSSFQTPTNNPERDFVRVGVGCSALLTDAVSVSLGYNTQVLDNGYSEQGVSGGVRVGF